MRESMSLLRNAIVLSAALLATGSASAASATSVPCVTWMKPEASLIWKTVTEMPVPISVDWPTGAVSARLTAVAGSRTLAVETIDDRAVSLYDLVLDCPRSESDECIVTLTLDFLDSGGTVIEAESRSANLAMVRGTCGGAFRCIAAGDSTRKWVSVEDRNAVVPVPEGTSSMSLDGAPLSIGTAPEWLWLTSLGGGSHTLSKTTDGSEYAQAILRVVGGFMINLR